MTSLAHVLPVLRFTLFFLLFSLMTAFVSDAAPKGIRSVWVSGKRYVYLEDTAEYYGFKFYRFPDRKRFAVYSGSDYAIFTADKRSGTINGTSVVYLFPLTFYKRQPVISELDLSKVLLPLFKDYTVPRGRIRTIMLDPGHGGKDTGAPGPNGKWEKAITLSLSMKLQKRLQQLGYRVLVTRNADVFPSLERRVDIANRWKPDLYISIHCNATGDRSISGVETFLTTPVGAPSSSDSKPGFNKSPGNNHDASNIRLAYEIQKSIIQRTRAADRGIKHARFYVIKNVNCPSVLIETGFLSNYGEGRKLTTSAYQDQLVNGMVNGIQAFARVSERRR